jgi:hypothetical protein
VDWPLVGTYSAEIAGNGHKITGVNFEFEANKSTKKFALFGSLAATANLHDFTIENAQISFSDGTFVSYGYEVAMIAIGVEEGAQLTNLNVTGVIVKGRVEEGSDVTFYEVAPSVTGVVITNCTFNVTLPE